MPFDNKNENAELAKLYRLVFSITAVALVAVLAHAALPDRHLRLLSDDALIYHLFYDEQNGGLTTAHWVNKDEFHFVCTASEGGIEWPYCGVEVVIGQGSQGRDYSGFDELEVKLSYQGDAEQLRVFMRHYDKVYSKSNTYEHLKTADAIIPARDLQEPAVVRPFEWRVPIDWLVNNQIPREHSFPDFSNIVNFGVDIVPRFPAGTHELKIDYLQFRGEWISSADWYLAVAVLWLVTLLAVIGYRMVHLNRRVSLDSDRLFHLATYTDSLRTESERYKALSIIDDLTGALNRAGLARLLDEHFPNGKLEADLSLLIIDLDHFKRINDTKGHDVGDSVLSTVASEILDNLRSTDRLVRWGGEEFVLLCPNTSKAEALLVSEKLRGVIANKSFSHPTGPLKVTASIGVGTAEAGEDFEALFKRVDQALYKAKELGRNCVVTAVEQPLQRCTPLNA